MMSSMLAPASIFSKIAATGIRVPLSTHAPLILPGMLSTAGHCDQSRLAMFQLLPSGYAKDDSGSRVLLTKDLATYHESFRGNRPNHKLHELLRGPRSDSQ